MYLSEGYGAIDAACDDALISTQCKALLKGYASRWLTETSDLELIEVEKTLTAPLRNLDSPNGRVSRKFTLAGKIDKLVKKDGRYLLVDHKTTAMDIEDPNSNYFRALRVESQPRHYEILLASNGYPLSGIVWDVVRKPTIRPKRISQAQAESIYSTGKYHDEAVSDATIQQLLSLKLDRENVELYGIRLGLEIANNPNKYYRRHNLSFLSEEIEQYNTSLWQTAEDMTRVAKRTEKTGKTPYSPSACMLYNSPCTYLGICSNHDSPDSERWLRKEDKHPELEGEAEPVGNRQLLTNSRVKCFQQCPAKHNFKYLMGLERVREERRAALYFGTVWHTGMDAWWTAVSGFERRQDDNESDD